MESDSGGDDKRAGKSRNCRYSEGSPSPKRPRNEKTESTNATDRISSGDNEQSAYSASVSLCLRQLSQFNSGDNFKVPQCLSQWNRSHLENLNIQVSYNPNILPLQLIKEPRVGIPSARDSEQLTVIKNLTDQSNFTEFLNILENVTEGFTDSRNSVKLWELFRNDESHSFVPENVPKYLLPWFYRFHCLGKQFAEYLYQIMKMRERGESPTASQYQFLFQSFTGMFGLTSGYSFAPCLPVDSLTIGDTMVQDAADIVYCNCKEKYEGTSHQTQGRVVAVCKVEKEKSLENIMSPSPPASNVTQGQHTEVSSSSQQTLHLSNEILGQHGGQLLLSSQKSMWNDKIFGIIVQETLVTFTVLRITERQFSRIVTGDVGLSNEESVSLVVTKPLDFLKKDDRQLILEALIVLGMYQRQ